jgi:adenosylcobinamide kinase / adenosylcobinamide-phosphate guanylyltransferase
MTIKIAFIGGIKSGKSQLAEACVQQIAGNQKPYYLATTQCLDAEMQQRIRIHQQRRSNQFITIEEPLNLLKVVQQYEHPILIECITMWINNMLYHQKREEEILTDLKTLLQQPKSIVFVHNEVGLGIIPDNPLARQFIDLSGKAGQLLGQYCDEVYFCAAGLSMRMK